MDWKLISAEMVDLIHDWVLNPGELTGRAPDKSLEGALARVENRVHYGLIGDVFDLAAGYAAAISQGHCFNDGNKRTAYRVMQVCLALHDTARPDVPEHVLGDRIIALAQGLIDDGTLADWLRDHG